MIEVRTDLDKGKRMPGPVIGRTWWKGFILLLCVCIFLPPTVLAEKIVVGVAANFILPFKAMVPAFEKRTGIGVDPIFTSTGISTDK